jgi:hypothetical protein
LSGDALAWANESAAIARDPNVGYCVTIGDTCRYEAGNPELDDGEPEKMVVANNAYLDRHAPVVRQRIAMAGVRLAGLLDEALGDRSPEAALRAELLARIAELKAAIETMRP